MPIEKNGASPWMLSKAGFPFVEVLAAIHTKPRG